MKKLYTIFTIAGFIIGVLITIFWSIPERLSTSYMFITFLPAIFMLFGILISSKIKNVIAHIVIFSITIISILVFAFSTSAVLLVNSATTEITDPNQCENLLENINTQNPDLVSFFPKDCHIGIDNRSFSYLPAFLQGGEHIQLKVQLSNIEFNELLNQYYDDALAIYHGGDTNDHSNMDPNIRTTFYYTSGIDDHKFPDSFEIIVLYARSCNAEDCGFEWNHGETSGLAVNSDENIVVYWAESW